MALIIILVFLPFIVLICGILSFNIYIRKQITKDTIPPPAIDQAYLEAEEKIPENEEFLGITDEPDDNKDWGKKS